ncbi:hypothetical protein MMC25_001340 [Agyrium rufum]|nr:hypothetical protein [Agyrium rufum]
MARQSSRLLIGPLPLLLLLRTVYSQQFYNPPSANTFQDPQDYPVYQEGETLQVRWDAPYDRISLVLWPYDGSLYFEYLLPNVSNPNTYDWIVGTDRDIHNKTGIRPNVFYLAIYQSGSTDPTTTNYFNISDSNEAAASATSTLTSTTTTTQSTSTLIGTTFSTTITASITSSTDPPTATIPTTGSSSSPSFSSSSSSSSSSSTATPAPVTETTTSSGLSQSAKIGLGVGLGIGIPLLLLLGGILGWKSYKTFRDNKADTAIAAAGAGGYEQPPMQQQQHHHHQNQLQPGQQGYDGGAGAGAVKYAGRGPGKPPQPTSYGYYQEMPTRDGQQARTELGAGEPLYHELPPDAHPTATGGNSMRSPR